MILNKPCDEKGYASQDERVRYTLAVLLDQPLQDFKWPDWLIYGSPSDVHSGVTVISSAYFGEDYGLCQSLPRLPLRFVEGLPILFGEPSVVRKKNQLIVHADILASAYFLLTRYEEWIRKEVRDEHGRFPGKESLAFRGGFIERPLVDEYAALLRKWVAQVGVELSTPRRRFSVLLTHDVDSFGPSRNPIRAARSLARGLLKREPWPLAARNALAALGYGRHACDNLEEVIGMDQRLTSQFASNRCRAAYFFMAGGTNPYDGRYRLQSPRVIRRLREVARSGADIGLHASYEAGGDPALIAVERRTLEEVAGLPIYKNRHHFLRWREPEHGAAIAEAGIRWDATLGYADVAGFRLGVCHRVPLFDPVRQRLMGIEECPLVAMDCTLDAPGYMNLSEEAALDCVRRLARSTLQHQGEFVILWHNTRLAEGAGSYHRRLYPRILEELAGLLAQA